MIVVYLRVVMSANRFCGVSLTLPRLPLKFLLFSIYSTSSEVPQNRKLTSWFVVEGISELSRILVFKRGQQQ